MKKNRMMRLASVLLVLVLLTTSVIGGTFAKYITSATASDEARVAYWGFGASEEITFDLFNVSSDTGILKDGLIAPGTEKTINFEFINAKADGRAPEVAYKVTVSTADSVAPSADLDAHVDWFYNGTRYADWSAFIAAIEANTKEYKPGTTLPEFLQSGKTNTIGWKWAFDDGSTTKDAFDNEWNKDDTALGNTAKADGEIDVKLVLTVTVEQLDTYTATP